MPGGFEGGDGALEVLSAVALVWLDSWECARYAGGDAAYRFGFELREYSCDPRGLPGELCAKVVEREMGSMTAPVVGS